MDGEFSGAVLVRGLRFADPSAAMERDIRISLKAIRYRRGGGNLPPIPPIQNLLSDLFNKVNSVADTLISATSDEETSHLARQYLLNNWNLEQCGAWSFQVCSYLPGLQSKYLKELDLTGKAVKLSNYTVKDERGEKLELATVFHVLAFGDVIIAERRRGAGGTQVLSMVLVELIRRHLDKTFPSMALEDVVSQDLRREIEAYGGAVGIRMRLQEPIVVNEGIYSEQLTQIKHAFSGSKDLELEWRATTVFKTEEVAAAYEEADTSEEIDTFEIKLKNGPSINLNRYRLHKILKDFPVDEAQTPELEAIASEMVDYLGELMFQNGNVSYLTPEGKLSNLIRQKRAAK